MNLKFDPSVDYGFTYQYKSEDELEPWDKFRLDTLCLIADKCDKIIDFGGTVRGLSTHLSFRSYTMADVNKQYSPDVVVDICNMNNVADGEYDGVICCSILEHVYNPFDAAKELYRILSKGGYLFVYVPFIFPYHAPSDGAFKDYWRFSKDGIKELFENHANLKIVEYAPLRYSYQTKMNLFKMFGKRSLFHRLFGKFLYGFEKFTDTETSGYNILITKE
jgi:SAM-dependent methyltransferase